MREADDQFVDDAVHTDGARQRLHLDIVRPVADEMIAIEAFHLRVACAAGERRDVCQVGFRRHRRHRGGDVPVDELGRDVGVEHGTQVGRRAVALGHGGAAPFCRCIIGAPGAGRPVPVPSGCARNMLRTRRLRRATGPNTTVLKAPCHAFANLVNRTILAR